MATKKKATYKVFNGTDFDEIDFKTTGEQVEQDANHRFVKDEDLTTTATEITLKKSVITPQGFKSNTNFFAIPYKHGADSGSILFSRNATIHDLFDGGTYLGISRGSGADQGVNYTGSDRKIKENIKEATGYNALNIIDKIKLYEFDYNEDHGNKHIKLGYIANQLEEIDESLIFKVEQRVDSPYYSEDDKYIRQPDFNTLIPHLISCIQELHNEIKTMKEASK